MSTNILSKEEVEDIRSTFDRLAHQVANARIMSDQLVRDDKVVPMPRVTADFSIGDFLIYDRLRHPEQELESASLQDVVERLDELIGEIKNLNETCYSIRINTHDS